MDKEQEQKLVFKIADLLRENKDLSNHNKNLVEINTKLVKKNDKLSNILSLVPPELLPKETSRQIKNRTKRFAMTTVLFADTCSNTPAVFIDIRAATAGYFNLTTTIECTYI